MCPHPPRTPNLWFLSPPWVYLSVYMPGLFEASSHLRARICTVTTQNAYSHMAPTTTRDSLRTKSVVQTLLEYSKWSTTKKICEIYNAI